MEQHGPKTTTRQRERNTGLQRIAVPFEFVGFLGDVPGRRGESSGHGKGLLGKENAPTRAIYDLTTDYTTADNTPGNPIRGGVHAPPRLPPFGNSTYRRGRVRSMPW